MKSKPTVFTVEDDAAVAKATSQLVEMLGFKAESYDSAEGFLEAYKPTGPVCLVLDVRMPGMSGPELQEKLLATGSTLPVIIITSLGDSELAAKAMKRGVIDILEKPFHAERLCNAIRKAIQLGKGHRL